MVRILSRIIFFLSIFIFVGCCTNQSAKYPTTVYINKAVYFAPNLTDPEKTLIFNALKSWECSTQDIVHFEIIWDATDYQISNLMPGPSVLIIRNAGVLDPAIVEADKHMPNHLYAIGLYHFNDNKVPEILMVEDMINDAQIYHAVALHEAGHALGLEHSSDNNAIMYYVVDYSSKSITNTDLGQFCMIYQCDAAQLRACE